MASKCVSQPELIGAILKHLGRCGIKDLNVRQLNAVVDAADEILSELNKPTILASDGMGLQAWLNSDDTGTSSCCLASTLLGFSREYGHPHDPTDFGRCLRMLRAVPEAMAIFDTPEGREKVSSLSREWRCIVTNWNNMASLYEEEYPTGKAPKLHKLMRQLEL